MLQKMYTPLRFTAILSLVLVFALSVAWAGKAKPKGDRTTTSTTTTSTTTTSTTIQTYLASDVIGGRGGSITITRDVVVKIPAGALNAYLAEKGVDVVEITVEMIDFGDGLLFIFGPSGAYFDPPLELTLKGDYFDDSAILVDELGEALEFKVQKGKVKSVPYITYYVPHFSRYSYDFYEY